MMNIKKVLTPLSYGIFLAASPAPSAGEVTGGSNFPQGQYGSLYDLVTGAGDYIFGFVSVFATFAVIYSGIMYITAGGDTAKSDMAKKNLTWAITGLAIALMAWFIVDSVTRIV